MKFDVRYANHPEDSKRYDTTGLGDSFCHRYTLKRGTSSLLVCWGQHMRPQHPAG